MTKKHKHETRDRPSGLQGSDGGRDEFKTDEAKVAAGEPVAVVGKEVPDAGDAQQLPANPVPPAEQEPEAPAQGPTTQPSQPEPPAAQEAQPEEAKPPRTDHLDAKGKPVYLEEFTACLFMAMGAEGAKKPELPENFDLIPFELASFVRSDPGAPDNAGLTHLKLKLKTILLPDEDPRRVELAVKLFRTAINGLDAIEKEDGEKNRLASEAAAFKPAHDRLDGDGPFDREGGRFEKSDTGKALDKQPRQPQPDI